MNVGSNSTLASDVCEAAARSCSGQLFALSRAVERTANAARAVDGRQPPVEVLAGTRCVVPLTRILPRSPAGATSQASTPVNPQQQQRRQPVGTWWNQGCALCGASTAFAIAAGAVATLLCPVCSCRQRRRCWKTDQDYEQRPRKARCGCTTGEQPKGECRNGQADSIRLLCFGLCAHLS